jgi:hypothetical protein
MISIVVLARTSARLQRQVGSALDSNQEPKFLALLWEIGPRYEVGLKSTQAWGCMPIAQCPYAL